MPSRHASIVFMVFRDEFRSAVTRLHRTGQYIMYGELYYTLQRKGNNKVFPSVMGYPARKTCTGLKNLTSYLLN